MPPSRLLRPRFDGAVVRDELPPGMLDVLAARAREAGMRVVEEPPESQRGYRTAPKGRAIRLEPEEDGPGWEGLRVWQEGTRVLRYEGWQRGSGGRSGGGRRVGVQSAFALGVVGGLLGLALVEQRLPTSIVLLVLVGMAALLWWRLWSGFDVRQTKRWIHAFLEGEVMRAEGAMPFGLKREPPARVSHDAFVRHDDVAPEAEVKALEVAGKRGE